MITRGRTTQGAAGREQEARGCEETPAATHMELLSSEVVSFDFFPNIPFMSRSMAARGCPAARSAAALGPGRDCLLAASGEPQALPGLSAALNWAWGGPAGVQWPPLALLASDAGL